uniref:Mab-21-like HhH/H2TH-like domain-containing protein n=1 Tax=Callorhinchus milii TaxID=7868 RepID=A0A4W3I4Z3_CALMI
VGHCCAQLAADMWLANGNRLGWYERYLSAIKSQQARKILDVQKCEDIVFTLLDRVHQQDYRFQVDYSRGHATFNYHFMSAFDEIDVEVPLWLDDSSLTVKESCKIPYHLNGMSHKTPRRGFCYLAVSKESESKWSGKDIFYPLPRLSDSSGHVIPGKVIHVLKELIKGAIVYCEQNYLISAGKENHAKYMLTSINVTTPHYKLTFYCILFHHLLKMVRNEASSIKPASMLYSVYRFCFERPIWKLLDTADADGGNRLNSLCILDSINTNHWLPTKNKRGLKFQHLQMVLLWAMKFFPAPEDWVDLESSVYRILVVLLRCLTLWKLPNYFLPEINVFLEDDQPQVDFKTIYTKVETFADIPEKFLQIHVTHLIPAHQQRIDNYIKMILHIEDTAGVHWNTGYFDVILNKMQVYRIQDPERINSMQLVWSKATKLMTAEGIPL